MSNPPHDIWKDPNVMAALKEGRAASDIAVLPCPECNEYGYYNDGSHFSCRFCNRTWLVVTEDDEPPEGTPFMSTDNVISLADTVTDTTDG